MLLNAFGVKYGVALKGKSLLTADYDGFIGGVCLVYCKFWRYLWIRQRNRECKLLDKFFIVAGYLKTVVVLCLRKEHVYGT